VVDVREHLVADHAVDGFEGEIRGWSRGARVDMGSRSEVLLELVPGNYQVDMYGPDVLSLQSKVEVRAGEVSELRLVPRAAALVRFVIRYPEDLVAAKASFRITDPLGKVLPGFESGDWDLREPQEARAKVPRGVWIVTVTTGSGLSGRTEFRVDSLAGDPPVVQVFLR
jgi:hypothetical protein